MSFVCNKENYNFQASIISLGRSNHCDKFGGASATCKEEINLFTVLGRKT
jgi:hypothetical protein